MSTDHRDPPCPPHPAPHTVATNDERDERGTRSKERHEHLQHHEHDARVVREKHHDTVLDDSESHHKFKLMFPWQTPIVLAAVIVVVALIIEQNLGLATGP